MFCSQTLLASDFPYICKWSCRELHIGRVNKEERMFTSRLTILLSEADIWPLPVF